MSLDVSVYTLDEAGDMDRVLDEPEPGAHLAGFESCREGLYGSSTARGLGLMLLPRLAHEDLYVTGDGLPRLADEVATLLAHVDDLAQATGYGADYIAARAGNIAAAVERARRIGGGVVIW